FYLQLIALDLAALEAHAVVLAEELLEQADGLGRHFHQLVVVDEFQRLLEGELDRRYQGDDFILAGGAHVVELLALGGVEHQIVVAAVDAAKLAFVNLVARRQKQLAARLQGFQRVGQRGTGSHGHQHAVLAVGHFAGLDRAVVAEGRGQDAGTRGQGQEVVTEADQAARRDGVFQAHAALAVGDHVGQVALAQAHLLHHRALVLLLDVDGDVLVRLLLLAGFVLDDHHFRAAHGQLEAFTAHGFDQYRQVQLATPGDLELLGALALLDAQRHVVQQLLVQAILDVAAGDELAFLAGERRVVDLEGHAHGRLVDGQRRQGLDVVLVAQGVGDVQLVHTRYADDVTGSGFLHFDALQTGVAHDLEDTAVALLAVGADGGHRAVGLDGAAGDAADAGHAEEAVVIQLGNLHLERAVEVDDRSRHVVDDGLEQGVHVVVHLLVIHAGDAVQGRGVDDREVQLLVGGTEVVEQVEDLVDDPVRTRARTVDLVDHDDRTQAGLERLLGHETGLRHRAVLGVDYQQHGVDHAHHTFHFTAEVGVSGGVDDVDVVVAPLQRRVLGENGNAALFFLVVGVHDALVFRFFAVEGAGQ